MKNVFNFSKSLSSTVVLAGALIAAPAVLDSAATKVGAQLALSSAYAQAADKSKKITRRLPGISEKVFKGINKVTELVSPNTEKNPDAKPDLPQALKELAKLEKKCAECNNLEKAQIYNIYAYALYQADRGEEAIEYYKKVAAQSPEIAIGLELQTLKYIGQFSYKYEKYDQAIEYLNRYMKLAKETNNPVNADMWQFMSVICYNKNDMKCAIESIDKAIAMVENAGKIADESWYNLKRSFYLQKEDYKVATQINEKLIKHFPKHEYWVQIGQMYGMQGRDKDQLHAMDTAYRMGAFKKERDVFNLASLYLAEEYPARAVKIMTESLASGFIKRTEKNLDLLAKAHFSAKNIKKAITVWKEAGEMSASGNSYAYLVGLYLDLNQPKESIKYGKLALKKGKFTRGADGDVYSNMGIAYFDLKQFDSAIKSFTELAKIKKHRRFANTWLRYTENEKKRYEGLKQALASVDLDIEQVIK